MHFWKEITRPEIFTDVGSSDFLQATCISVQSGKCIHLDHYEQPGKDALGAKFYFPRLLPDGRPLVTSADKQLRFESRIRGKKIEARFNVRRLSYRGKLEM